MAHSGCTMSCAIGRASALKSATDEECFTSPFSSGPHPIPPAHLTGRSGCGGALIETIQRHVWAALEGPPLLKMSQISTERETMEPFKNKLSGAVARVIASALERSWRDFDSERFLLGIDEVLEPLELKARMLLIADRLENGLPKTPGAAFQILCGALKRSEKDGEGLDGFPVWPLGEVISRQGLEDFPAAMHALREVTIRFTSEFAIRRFLRERLDETLDQMGRWTQDPNEHVRRLASEGSRPMLPWGGNLPAIAENPGLTLPILERLWNDPSEYVRRSVANHLNDFSKKHPGLVIETLTRWKQAGSVGFASLANRAARTLLKNGDAAALAFFGYGEAEALRVEGFQISPKTLRIGGTLRYDFCVINTSETPVTVMFDYAIHHRKKDGRLTPKVFKGKVRKLAPGEAMELSGGHKMPMVTTRTYYSGRHELEVLLNGRSAGRLAFDFLVQ